MNKIKDAVRDRMRSEALTDAQVSFMIVISRYQNDNGCIQGIHYKRICKEAHISFATFYTCIRDLEEKGLIETIQNKEFGDWDIIIKNNDFSYEGALNEGYIDTNHEIFFNDHFYEMTAIEKLLAMDLLRICQSNKELKGCYRIGVENFYEKYRVEFNIYAKQKKLTKRVLQGCLKTLKKFFSIGIKNRMYWFRPLKEKVYQKEKLGRRTEPENLKKFVGAFICRRLKLTYKEDDFKDTIDLLTQYGKICKKKCLNIINLLFVAVKKSIEKINENEKNKKYWKRELRANLVHNYIKDEIYPTGPYNG